MLKRGFDLVVILGAGVPILLVCLIVAALVKATSPGPVLYWSDRVGVRGRIFRMPKFRTMRTDTPVVATHLLQNPAQWITPVGGFLRSSSLDELPQLLSVLLGDMSLVGPRPALYNQVDLVAARKACGVDALQPGITGWAQINGRDELPIPQKVAFDYEYLQRHSFGFDLKILLLTVVNVMLRRGVSH
jgi:O-antigen biosynthesis protein WbqP